MLVNTVYESKVNQLRDIAVRLHGALQASGIRYQVIGGFAVFCHVDRIDPLAARLFLTAMLVASYFVYPVKVLAVDDETKTQIMEGVVAELVKLRKPDGLFVGREDIELVRSLVSSFYDCIVKDMDQGGNRDAGHPAPHSTPPKATELLLSLLVSHYSGGGPASQAAVAKLAQQGFYHPSYAAVTEMVDEAAHIPHRALANSTVKLAGS